MEETTGYGLNLCLQMLSNAEFLRFKSLYKEVQEQFKLKPMIPWTTIEKSSRKDMETLLHTHYPGLAWAFAARLFDCINRQDLFRMTEKLMRGKQRPYREIMKTIFNYIWTKENNIYLKSSDFKVSIKRQYSALKEVFDDQLKPVTLVVLGESGIGKSTFLRRAMLDWASGDLWNNRFHYVFFFSLISLNNTTELSLAQLLLSKLSESSEALDDVLSNPRRILFILEGFDYLNFDLELQTDLCSDWKKSMPTQIVLRSLLQKVMLPESSLILELGPQSEPKIYPLLRYPRKIILGGLLDSAIRLYCLLFFEVNEGVQVFNYIAANEPLFCICKNPHLCWVVCSTIKWKCARREEAILPFDTDSALYASFILSSFRSKYDKCLPKENRARLKTLCTLAVEGMWKRVFVFNSEDLRRNGICESELTVWLQMNFLNTRGDCFVFYSPTLQWYFGALFYFLREGKEKHNPIIGSLPQLLSESYAHSETQLFMPGMFVLGIATENVAAMLNPHFGLIPSKAMRQEIFKCFRSLSQGEGREKLILLRLFDGLLENQDERFETQVLDLFEEMTVHIGSHNELSTATIYLPKSKKLKKLHMHIEHRIFSDVYKPEDSDLEDFIQGKIRVNNEWREICSIFQNLKVLDLDSCNFNETAIQNLCLSISDPKMPLNAFKLESMSCSFMTNFGDGALFPTLLRLPHLKSLNLYGTRLSSDVVGKMCSVLLTCPTCRVEELLLSHCCLTFIACGHLYEALLCNKFLSLLDLGSNFLEDAGVNILCEALKKPVCTLQELWLTGCSLTSACCERISAVLSCQKNLKTLKLGNNNIQDTGVQQLCKALRNPECKLQCLGLDMCEFTTSSCADLAMALTKCQTLTSLNLDWMTFDPDGLELLCEALNHKGCTLKVLGLDKSAFSKESQMLLAAVQKKTKLNILHYPWIKEERKKRGVCLVWNSKN
ncbi:NACHT, LRR and PYD domains-containing protein 9A isoform X2 [Mesocricetus auratus]|uniref:NACHT, LRR and PYD domains-containing protein 9A isoform X2 n=1 Tax=Mesocricetus auratus TaxID=10036 RepID=A0ABM2WEF3_MESAU|nr:NACHT, LRR and PYD domains-containing protein 9A isoform X2 [Mesocricetus auratus]